MDQAVTVYDTLMSAGEDLGYERRPYAITLRLEKGYRAGEQNFRRMTRRWRPDWHLQLIGANHSSP